MSSKPFWSRQAGACGASLVLVALLAACGQATQPGSASEGPSQEPSSIPSDFSGEFVQGYPVGRSLGTLISVAAREKLQVYALTDLEVLESYRSDDGSVLTPVRGVVTKQFFGGPPSERPDSVTFLIAGGQLPDGYTVLADESIAPSVAALKSAGTVVVAGEQLGEATYPEAIDAQYVYDASGTQATSLLEGTSPGRAKIDLERLEQGLAAKQQSQN